MTKIEKLRDLIKGDIVLQISEDSHGAFEPSEPEHWQPTIQVVEYDPIFTEGVRFDGACWNVKFNDNEVVVYEEQDGTFADGEFGPCEIYLLHRESVTEV